MAQSPEHPLDLSCIDWEDRIRRGQSLIPADAKTINPALAKRVVDAFNLLRIPDLVARPTFAEAGADWFREMVGAILGSIDPVTGARLIRELFCLVPKKNNKTTGSAGIMLTALVMNVRPRAEFLLVGPTHAVSELAFNQVVGMIEADAFLMKRMQIIDHQKTIRDRRTKAELKIKTFDAAVLTGVKPVGVLLDELHEIAKTVRASRIIGQLRGGMLPNPEAFLIIITTQSDDRPVGAFKDELTVARDIRDGKMKGSMLPVLYEFPTPIAKDQAQWERPENWKMVNPNLGLSVTLPRLIEDFTTARRKGEAEIRRWASQHLNIEIGVGLRNDAWAGAERWSERADPSITFETLLERCELIVPGLDGGGLDDLYGANFAGREREETIIDTFEGGKRVKKSIKRWLLWSHAWCHRGVLHRRQSIASTLEGFAQDGDLTIVDDELDDVFQIVELIRRVKDAGLLYCVAVDPAGIGEMIEALAAIEVTLEKKEDDWEFVIGAPQGFAMMNAIKTAERRVVNGTLLHAGQPLMDWCVGNLKIEATATAIKATKQNAGDAKIDPAIAMFNAVAVLSRNPEARGSYLDSEDLMIV